MPTPTTDVEAYCDRCEAMVVMVDPAEQTTNTGKVYLEGACPECAATVVAIPAADSKRDA